MPNKRIFYASHGVAIDGVINGGALNPTNDTINGAQSVSINTNYNLRQAFQLGRLPIYDQIPSDAEVEVTLSKILDGHLLIWNHANQASAWAIKDTANTQCNITLHVDDETNDALTGAPTVAVLMTGCYVNSLNYNFPVDDNFTEEVTFVGSSKEMTTNAITAPEEDPNKRVLSRQNFIAGSGTLLPTGVAGKCISNISISADLGREKIYCLGAYQPYHRFVNFPIEITISFDITQDGNGPSLLGPDFSTNTVSNCEAAPVDRETIYLSFCDDDGDPVYEFDLGSGCALQSVSYSGGDTGGGNVTETYTYVSYNNLTIKYNPFH